MVEYEDGVEFFTNQYRIVGTARVAGQRLTDVLNDELTSSVELQDVQVCRLLAPEQVVAAHPSALLYKAAILLAASGVHDDVAAERSFFKHVDTKEWDVFVTVPSFELTGKFHVRGTGDLKTMLLRWAGEFIPLTEAEAVYTLYPEVTFQRDVIIVNRAHMEVICSDRAISH